jgi:NADH-quinone oxidoreductase subunit B
VSNEELTFRSKHNDHRREPMVITEVPQEFVDEMKSVATESQQTVKEEEKA